MSGGVVQLVAVGPQDAWLTGKPEVSFYRSNYRRYTHFANSVERQVIQGAPIANGISTIRFEKKGDLLSYVYLTARDNNGAGIVGLDWSKVIDKVELMIGGQIVDTHDFEYMADIEPLVGAQNYSQRYLNLNNASLNNQKASFFPFKFFFCKEWTLCLPLIALQFHDVEIRITWSSYLNQTITFGVPTNISATQVSQLTATSATVTLPAGATGTLAATGGVTGSVLGFTSGDTITFSAGTGTATTITVGSVPSGSTSSITVSYTGGSIGSIVPGTVVTDTTASPNFKALVTNTIAAATATGFTLNLLPIPNQVYLNGTLPNAAAVAIASSTTVTSATVSFPYGFTSNVYAGAPPLGLVRDTTAVIPPSSYPLTSLAYTAPTLTLTYPTLSTAPAIGEFALGIQGVNSGSNTWQGAFVTTSSTTVPKVTFVPAPAAAVPTTVPTSNIVYVQPVYSPTTIAVSGSSGGPTNALTAGTSVSVTGLNAKTSAVASPGSAFIYTTTTPTKPNLYYTGIVDSVLTDTSLLVHFPLGSSATTLSATLANYVVSPAATANPTFVSATAAALTGSVIMTLNNITGAPPTLGQLVAGIDFTITGSAPTMIGAYLTAINTAVTPTQYTVSYYITGSTDITVTAPLPSMISFFNISVPVTALTGTPTLTTTSTYSTVTSVSQTDPNISAGQLITTSPTSLKLTKN
jgi:hypothetical protein